MFYSTCLIIRHILLTCFAACHQAAVPNLIGAAPLTIFHLNLTDSQIIYAFIYFRSQR